MSSSAIRSISGLIRRICLWVKVRCSARRCGVCAGGSRLIA
jgi:hypothetical protein